MVIKMKAFVCKWWLMILALLCVVFLVVDAHAETDYFKCSDGTIIKYDNHDGKRKATITIINKAQLEEEKARLEVELLKVQDEATLLEWAKENYRGDSGMTKEEIQSAIDTIDKDLKGCEPKTVEPVKEIIR